MTGYVGEIKDSANAFWHGMSITLSHMFRRPTTIQYPDRIDVPVRDTLPARYRGFLEVDMDVCTGCLACERACPINCIAIDVEKTGHGAQRVMTRFDIDIAKCMYCGLCVEPCPTGAIQHTREFEGATMTLRNLFMRFVDPEVPAPLYKPPKGAESYVRKPVGEIVRAKIKDWDAVGPMFPLAADGKAKAKVEKKGAGADVIAEAHALATKAIGVAPKILENILESAMAGTDCGACGYPTCQEYSEAISVGKEGNLTLCEPGGEESRLKVEAIMAAFRTGAAPSAAAPSAQESSTPAAS